MQEILEDRHKKYGDFMNQAVLSQDLKRAMKLSRNWSDLDPSMKEAMEMIQHKIARILNGDPNYADSWVDIAGYATLIVEHLKSEETKQSSYKEPYAEEPPRLHVNSMDFGIYRSEFSG